MHIHPISIQVPSVTSVATGCIFLTALIILGMLGLGRVDKPIDARIAN